MGTKAIITAEMKFLQARQRVQKKPGKNKTGKVPPTTTLTNIRGGPRPGLGREMGKVLPTKALAALRDGPRPGPGQEKIDMDHPRSGHGRGPASGPRREPAPHPHGALRHEHPGVDPLEREPTADLKKTSPTQQRYHTPSQRLESTAWMEP